MRNNVHNNAAERRCYAGRIFNDGVSARKKEIIHMLPEGVRKAVKEGYIYIHDLEGYGEVYNCCCPDTNEWFLIHSLKSRTEQGKIFEIFQLYQELIAEMALNQTGGIGFVNFDQELSDLLEANYISLNESNKYCLQDALGMFLEWINISKTRYNREPYYVTLNVGLCTEPWGRIVTDSILEFFMLTNYIRPNIVFKVNMRINSCQNTPNYDLFQTALECTAKTMIPTYLLTDSIVNQRCKARRLAIMGCRTRVYKNMNGSETSEGRGNIAYVTLNLPKLALTTKGIDDFYSNLNDILLKSIDILLHRKNCFLKNKADYMLPVFENGLWGNVRNKEEMVLQGTFSVGFIGLEEAAEILFQKKRYENKTSRSGAEAIIRYLSEKLEWYSNKTALNFTLLATSAENVCGVLCKNDKRSLNSSYMEKGFYTNSFHVAVDANISPFEKIDLEAPYHLLCTGGAISYIELKEAVLKNTLALLDLIQYAEKAGISYLGFNFPLDICNVCGEKGTFELCPRCQSSDILRVRRVSGYLENLDFFSEGKREEVRYRRNIL